MNTEETQETEDFMGSITNRKKRVQKRVKIRTVRKNLLVFVLSSVFLFTAGGFISAEAENNGDDEKKNGDDKKEASVLYGLFGTYEKRHNFFDDQYEANELYETQRLRLGYYSPMIDIVAEGSLNGDMEYTGGDEQSYIYDRYFGVHDAYIRFHPEPLSFKFGRYPLEDEVNSPYPLYLSEKENPHLSAEISYETDRFLFHSSWTELNRDSRYIYTGSDNFLIDSDDDGTLDDINPDVSDYYDESNPDYEFFLVPESDNDPDSVDKDDIPEFDDDGISWVDRGLNYRSYAVKFGGWTVGFQETAVYFNDSFEAEFLLNPVPMFVMQTIFDKGGGRPWGRYEDIKSQMGLFAEVDRHDWNGYGQILIDDVNANFVEIISGTSHGHQKLAWSLGGEKEFSFGKLGFYHAGATKYTFSATHTFDHTQFNKDEVPLWYSSKPYPYTYYQSNVIMDGNDKVPIHYRENYIGYEYGENSLSFMVDYENELFEGTDYAFRFHDSLEYAANGAKSPVDPWHEYNDYKNISGNFHLFEGTVEHKLVNTLSAAKEFGRFTLSMDIEAGYIFNKMKLVRVVEGNDASAYRFVPQSEEGEPIFELTIGGTYSLDSIGM